MGCIPLGLHASQQKAPAKNLLIINSYNENSPWAKSMTEPILYHVSQNDSVYVQIAYLNSALITDSLDYAKAKANALRPYMESEIDYVVFIGNPAFTLRSEVVERWGDIPLLLITRELALAPDEYYFTGYDQVVDNKLTRTVSDLRPEFNFTTIYVPDLYKETIDMMVKLIPEMDELVFFSDGIYFNRYLSWDIENYLMAEYPNINYRWVKASAETSHDLTYYLTQRMPNKGLLISSWFYEQPNALGYPELVSNEINLLYRSINPVFSLREAYLKMGSIGGVYTDREGVREAIVKDVNAMLEGKSMRDIKFAVKREPRIPMLSYPLFKEYKLNASNCPPKVVFINKPQSFLEKYYWELLGAIVALAIIIFFMLRRSALQSHQIETLSRHKQFIDNMPIPYTKAKVVYDEGMNGIHTIKYMMSNQAFDEIIKENSTPGAHYLLFTPEFISKKTAEMIRSEKPVSFLHYFEKSGKYYMFTLCLVNTKKREHKDIVDTIDVFAIDVTTKQKTEEQLKDITRRLDMTLDVAHIIPWEWDMRKDIVILDAVTIFQRQKRSYDQSNLDSGKSVLSTAEFMKLVHEDDRELLRGIRERVYLDKIEKFTMEYRVKMARQNQEVIEWVEIRGSVVDRDEVGKPIHVMGSLCVITDRKQREFEIEEIKRKATQVLNAKKQEMSKLSYDVRAKLTDIFGNAQLMNESDDAQERHSYMETIAKANNELLEYLNAAGGEKSPESQEETKTAETETELQPRTPKRVAPVVVPRKHKDIEKMDVSPDGRQPTVLIAEDIEGNYLLIKHFIPKGYTVHHAWTGQEAVDMFHSLHPDIILMDIGMKVMDGYQATKEIRKFSVDIPIIAVTAYTFASEREQIMKSGFNDYVTKPVTRESIQDAIARHLKF